MYLSGIPALGLPHDTSDLERLAHIFGLSPSQLNRVVKSIKDNAAGLFRRQIKRYGMPEGRNKQLPADAVALLMYRDAVDRHEVLKAHAEAVERRPGVSPGVPVLEYALLEAWNPLKRYSHGEFTSIGEFPSPEEQRELGTPALCVRSPGFTASFCYSFAQGHLFKVFPRWLVADADMIVSMLTSWDSFDRDEQIKLAGAAFAVASALMNTDLLKAFLNLEPRLGLYLQGVVGLAKGLEPWHGEVWKPDPSVGQYTWILSKSIIKISAVLGGIAGSGNLATLNGLRGELDYCEQLVLNQAVEDARQSIESLDGIEKALTEVTGMAKAAGFELTTKPLQDRLAAWRKLVAHERMQTASHEQSQLIAQLNTETTDYTNLVDGLALVCKEAADEREGLLRSELPWAEQSKKLQDLLGSVQKVVDAFDEFSKGCSELPELKLPAQAETDDAPPCPEALKSELTRRHKDQLKALEEKLDAANQKYADLRRENSELKKKMGAMRLYTNGHSGTPTASARATDNRIDALEAAFLQKATNTDVISLMEIMHPDRVVFTKSAKESLEDSGSAISPARLHERLEALVTAGLDEVRKSGQIIDCASVVPGEVAVRESKTVQNSARLRKAREFRYKGKTHTFYPHLSLDHVHRLHFDYFQDDDEGRFVVAYIGRHLPNDSNATP